MRIALSDFEKGEGMVQFNSFIGSLASSGITYGMTGNVTFNLAKLSGGIQSDMARFKGSGGTDISLWTIAVAARGAYNWGKNIQIEDIVKKTK